MGKKINYNARTFEDYQAQLKSFTQKYYPTIINDFNDASVGQWFIDLNSAVADDLGYYMDRMFQETQLDQAQERKSILSIARTNGLRVDGKRPSIVEAQWTCFVPVDSTDGKNSPDYSYAPILQKGTQASGGGQKFELMDDLNFAQQFNKDAVSDRSFMPIRNSNGVIQGYNITKTCVMVSTESKVYKQTLTASDIQPFLEIVLPENNVVTINSIIIKEGFNKTTPTTAEFMSDSDIRWYEVKNFTEDVIFSKDLVKSRSFGDKLINDMVTGGNGITGATNYGNTYVAHSIEDNSTIYGFIPSVGQWKNVSRKFVTEYTDKGYCKIIFGGGTNNVDLTSSIYNASDFTKYQISKMVNNSFLGELPPANSTVYIYYSVGGGAQSNIAANTMTNIPYLNMAISGTDGPTINNVKNSIRVTNTIPSVSGRDELSSDEIKFLIKYNNAAQDRCVTIKDYYNRIMTMPSEFGSPFKLGVSERNNKILVTILGLAIDGTLSKNISQIMIDNIIQYLSEYKMINDYVEIQPGKIINVQFQVDVTVDNSQQQADVAKAISLYIGDYMDINKHKLGEEIYVSKMKSYIGSISGVKNLIDLRVYNKYGTGYSNNHTKQAIIGSTQTNSSAQIDLTASDGVLFSEDDTMFEIKNPKADIIINAKYK
jgi:hypothetical protein